MPLDRFVLIILCVIAAAGATVLLGSVLFTTWLQPVAGLGLAVPLCLIGYVVWRVIADRIEQSEDDSYDEIER